MCRSQGEFPQLLKLVVTVFSLSCITSIANAALRLQTDPQAIGVIQSKLTKLPLSFEANPGQADSQTQFLSRVPGMTLRVKPGEMTVTLNSIGKGGQGKSQTAAVSMKLVNANRDGALVGEMEQPGKSNYLVGKNPKHWKTNIAHFARVRQAGVYPGIDLVYHGDNSSLEYDFVVAPGADPARIRLAFSGVDGVVIRKNGDLRLKNKAGEFLQKRPLIYQEIDGARRIVEGKYVKIKAREVAFHVARYDNRYPLTIDPVLAYATYFGGSGGDTASAIAVDDVGNAYITGYTNSTDFPASPGASQGALVGTQTAYVAKIDTVNNVLVYATYLGGGSDQGNDIAIDSFGNAYVTGYTDSNEFPIVSGFQATHSSGGTSGLATQLDTFIAKLNPTGSALLFSSYLGGSTGDDISNGIAVDDAGMAYIVGNTGASDFPVFNAFQAAKADSLGPIAYDAFIAKINTATGSRIYVTYLGGNDTEFGANVATDGNGSAYVVGRTTSTNFPTLPGAFQPNCASAQCGYVSKLNSTGSLAYSTFLTGASFAGANAIALDAEGNAYISGISEGALPQGRVIPIELSAAPGIGVFVAKLNPTGSALIQSTWTPGAEETYGIALGADGSSYVTGSTGSSPMEFSATESIPVNSRFVLKYDPTATQLRFFHSFDAGGSLQNRSNTIAVDSSRNVYVVAQSSATTFPTTSAALQSAPNGSADAILLKLADPLVATTTTLSVLPPAPARAGDPLTLRADVSNALTGTVTFHANSLVLGTAPLGAGSATLSTSIPTAGASTVTATFGAFGDFQASTSTPLQLDLIKADATVSLRVSTDEVHDGDTFTASATVRGANPTGFVKFRANDDDIATVGINPDGTASALLGARGFGSLRVQAEYSGDANNETANSNEETVTVGSLGGIFGGGGGCTIGSDSRFEPILILSLILSFAAIGWRRRLFRQK